MTGVRRREAPEDLRYERKYLVEDADTRGVEAVVRRHPAMFREIYGLRYINNIYFDTPDLRDYWASVEGACDRKKVRIRWYQDLFGATKAAVELKIRQGLVMHKEIAEIGAFSLRKGGSPSGLLQFLSHSGLPDSRKAELEGLTPTLLNRYARRYFRSADGRFRITIDFDLSATTVRGNLALQPLTIGPAGIVLELKYGIEHDAAAGSIAQRLPYRLSRSSKYVSGVSSFHGLEA